MAWNKHFSKAKKKMKVLRVAALALLSVQCFGAVFDSNRFLASLRSAPLGGQHDVRAQRGPAVNWTWSSWLAGGPTCVDNSNLTLVDIPPTTESVRKVLAQLQGLLDYKVCWAVLCAARVRHESLAAAQNRRCRRETCWG